MGMATILFDDVEHLNKLAIPFWQKAHVKSGDNCSSSLKEDI